MNVRTANGADKNQALVFSGQDPNMIFSPHPCRASPREGRGHSRGEVGAGLSATAPMTEAGATSRKESPRDGRDLVVMPPKHALDGDRDPRNNNNNNNNQHHPSGNSRTSSSGNSNKNKAPTTGFLQRFGMKQDKNRSKNSRGVVKEDNLDVLMAPSLFDDGALPFHSSSREMHPTRTSKSLPPPPPPPKHSQPPQRQMILLNLDEVVLSRSRHRHGDEDDDARHEGSGSHRTPHGTVASRGTSRANSHRTGRSSAMNQSTNHSSTVPSEDLSRDAQNVLGGLRRQRETRENKKMMRASVMRLPSSSSPDADGIDPAVVNPHSSKQRKAWENRGWKKNGIEESDVVGTVLIVPAPGGCGDAGNHETGPPAASGVLRTTRISNDVRHASRFSPPEPAHVPGPTTRTQKFTRAVSVEEYETGGLVTSRTPWISPSQIHTERNSPRKPFAAPPPLMEDWSDGDENDMEMDSDTMENAGTVTAAASGADVGGRLDDSFSRTVLRDYCSLMDGDLDDRKWMLLMGDDEPMSPEPSGRADRKSASTEVVPIYGTGTSDPASRFVEESKENEECPPRAGESLARDPADRTAAGGHEWDPYTFPSTRSLELQFLQQDITVAPGVKLPLRGAQETMAALRRSSPSTKARSDFCTTRCWTCEAFLCCLRDAEYVLCPCCRVVSPLDVVPSIYDQEIEEEDKDDEYYSGNLSKTRRGVALGFTDAEWLQWRQQVSLYDG